MYTLIRLTQDIQSGASIAIHKDGTWHKRWDPWGITAFFRRIFGLEKSDNLELASLVKHFIKSTELTSKNAHATTHPGSDLDIQQAIEAVKIRLKSQCDDEQREDKRLKYNLSELKTLRDLTQDGLVLTRQYNPDPEAIKGVEERLGILEKQIKQVQRAIKQHDLDSLATKSLSKLAIHSFAKQMRQLEQTVINNTPAQSEDIEWVKQELAPWKKHQFPAMPINFDDANRPVEFSKDDHYKIEALCRYSKAIDRMRTDREYRESIFKFVFKTPSASIPNSADIAVQFPALTKKITSCYVDKRVKRITKTAGIVFKEEYANDVLRKDVCLRIQKVDEPLSDMTRRISFVDKKAGRDRILTIDQIFHEFRTKDATGISHFEFTENGVDLCYPKKPIIDFSSPTWWDGLPIIERLSRQEVEQKYSVTMAGKKAVLAIRATREKDPLFVQNNHGWLQVVIPHDDGTFTVHALGKYTLSYPQRTLELLLFAFNTHLGVIATIDENEFYSHRESCTIPKELSNEQFERLMDKLKRDLQDSFSGNMVFQSQGQNCSAWVQEVLDDVFGTNEDGSYKIPRLFEVPVIETSAPSIIGSVVRSIRFLEKISHHLAKISRIALATLLGGARSITTTKNGQTIKNSTISYEPWLRGYLALPALLFSREKQQKLREAFRSL